MTILALVRGKQGTYNALLADTGATGPDGDVAQHDKLHRIFGETFVSCVGDASLLSIIVSRVRLTKSRPNLRDAQFITSVYEELHLARRNGVLLGSAVRFPPAPPCTTLTVCNREQVFFWKVEQDPSTQSPTMPDAPTHLALDCMVVMRGVTVVTIEGFFTVPLADAEELIIDQMLNVNTKLEADGAERLGYTLSRRVSGIILPHKSSDAAIRIDPGVPPLPIRGLQDTL